MGALGKHRHTSEQEKGKGTRGGLRKPNTPPEATNELPQCGPETKGLATKDLPQQETKEILASNEEDAPEHEPEERSAPEMPYGPTAVATSSPVETGGEGSCPQDPKSDNLGVRQVDPLSDGVYQHSKILSPGGWLKIWLLSIDHNPLVLTQLEQLVLMA